MNRLNKNQTRETYRRMLEEHGVNWKAPWGKVLKLIINDFRYNTLIKSVNERKSIFIAWSKQKERKEREEIHERLKLVRAKAYLLLENTLIKSVNERKSIFIAWSKQ